MGMISLLFFLFKWEKGDWTGLDELLPAVRSMYFIMPSTSENAQDR